MKLNFQDRRLDAGDSAAAAAGQRRPDANGVVRRRRGDPVGLLRPGQRADRRPVGADDFRDAARQEIPNDQTPVRTADGQQRADFVEGTAHGHRRAIQRAIEFFRIILLKGR